MSSELVVLLQPPEALLLLLLQLCDALAQGRQLWGGPSALEGSDGPDGQRDTLVTDTTPQRARDWTPEG